MTDWNQLRECASGQSDFVAAFQRAVTEGENAERAWVRNLIADGYDAAHPNDGWVNREENYFQLVYPQFRNNVRVGSKVMLGWANHSQRPVVVTHIKPNALGGGFKYYFADKERTP